jgi:periplasmic protein TonB
LDQTAVAFVEAQRPWRVSRRGPGRFGRVAFISLWLHLTLLALLLVTVHYNHQEEMLPPPSTVSMVFEGGSPKGPALPNSRPYMTPAPEAAPPVPQPPVPQAAVPPPPPPPAPQTALAPPPTPPPQTQAQPAPSPTPPPPPTTTAELPLPPPPPPLAMVVPRPALPPSRPVQPPSATPRPTAPNRSQAFPTPMNFSFNPAPPAQRAPAPARGSSRTPSTMDFSLAPRQGASDLSPFAMVTGAQVGPDWRNELSAWVKAHAYYPEQAAMNGEDGSAMVLVQANPDGHVTSVELERKSGSQWLDLALLSLFRDAHLPPIFGEKEPIGFHFTMHYILIRQ